MSKWLRIAFSGNVVLTPDYPDDLNPVPGPITAIMPGARRRRRSTFRENPIDAQLAFLVFPYRHLVVEEDHHRDADYKYPSLRDITTGICFLEREDVFLETFTDEHWLTFDPSPITTHPTTASTGTRWIARWQDFAPGGNAALLPGVLYDPGDYVRVNLPGGHVAAGFAGEPIARVDFDYIAPNPRIYAQEIAVTLTFDDSVTAVSLGMVPHPGTGDPWSLVLRWYDNPMISILIGNGSLASILNVLDESFVGRDHEGDFDLEFEVMYDVMHCDPDQFERLPVPRLMSREVLTVPCIPSMVGYSQNAPTAPASSSSAARVLTDALRQQPRRGNTQRRK